MEKTIIFDKYDHIYNHYDFDYNIKLNMVTNRLFCTFTTIENLYNTLNSIVGSYTIMYNKIFILYSKDTNEYLITYNIEPGNTSHIQPNTILVHRKKDYNVLYTVNSLNELIKKLNNGVLDISYSINWELYRNSILLTNQGEFKQLSTKIYKIIEV